MKPFLAQSMWYVLPSIHPLSILRSPLYQSQQGKTRNVKGGIILTCNPSNSNQLLANVYSNPLCTGTATQSLSFTLNKETKIYNNVYLTLKKLTCSSTDCGVEVTIASDCSGSDSATYSNLAIPPNSCQTLAHDFGYGTSLFSIIKSVPYSIFPTASVDALFADALKFECCESDSSLLIYQYADSNCDMSTDYNTLRLSNEYNGQCFVLGDDQIPFDASSNKANANDIDDSDNVYALKYSWTCDVFVDCTGIEFMNDDQLPNFCPSACLAETFEPTNTPTLPVVTMDPSSDPTMEPTIKPTVPKGTPTTDPSPEPTKAPSSPTTFSPTSNPTYYPTSDPSAVASLNPTRSPAVHPATNDKHSVTEKPANQHESAPFVEYCVNGCCIQSLCI